MLHQMIIKYAIKGMHLPNSIEFQHAFCVLIKDAVSFLGATETLGALLSECLPEAPPEAIQKFLQRFPTKDDAQRLSLCKKFLTNIIQLVPKKQDRIKNLSTPAFLEKVKEASSGSELEESMQLFASLTNSSN